MVAEAEQLVEAGRRQLADERASAETDLTGRREALEAEEVRRREQTDAELAALHSGVVSELGRFRTEAQAEADQRWAELAADRERFEAEAAQSRNDAQAEREWLRRGPGEGGRQLAAAEAHVNWTQEAMAGLRASAESEVEAMKRHAHQELAEHARNVREQVELASTTTAHRHQAMIAEATATAEDLQGRSKAVLEAAERDAANTSQRAQRRPSGRSTTPAAKRRPSWSGPSAGSPRPKRVRS